MKSATSFPSLRPLNTAAGCASNSMPPPVEPAHAPMNISSTKAASLPESRPLVYKVPRLKNRWSWIDRRNLKTGNGWKLSAQRTRKQPRTLKAISVGVNTAITPRYTRISSILNICLKFLTGGQQKQKIRVALKLMPKRIIKNRDDILQVGAVVSAAMELFQLPEGAGACRAERKPQDGVEHRQCPPSSSRIILQNGQSKVKSRTGLSAVSRM